MKLHELNDFYHYHQYSCLHIDLYGFLQPKDEDEKKKVIDVV